ncbi:UPF0058 family protein [Natrialbaceae archaeon A-chndr2]
MPSLPWKVILDSIELVHLHALIYEIRRDMEERGASRDNAFDLYDAQPIRPVHINRQKEDHKRAVDELLGAILDELHNPETEYQYDPERQWVWCMPNITFGKLEDL